MAVPFRNERKDSLFDDLPEPERREAEATAAGLLARYDLRAFHDDSTAANYRENLFYLELLERALRVGAVSLPATVAAVDIGPSSWFYVQALHALLRWWDSPGGREVTLTGYEVAAHRLRYDSALLHLRGLPGVTYLPQVLRGTALRLRPRHHAVSLRVPRESPGMGPARRAVRAGAPPLEGLGERQARRGPRDRQPARGSTARKASSSRPTGSPSSPPSVTTRRSSATTSPVTSWWRAGRRERAAADGQNQAGEQVAA